jgi:chromosome segregation ATPase
VALTQDDDDKFDIIPASDFVLSRTALRNGQSNYYLNDRKINWTEATELLMAKGESSSSLNVRLACLFNRSCMT